MFVRQRVEACDIRKCEKDVCQEYIEPKWSVSYDEEEMKEGKKRDKTDT